MTTRMTPGGGARKPGSGSKHLHKKPDKGLQATVYIRTMGNAVRVYRVLRNLSQKEFCDLVYRKTGNRVGTQTISDLENGRYDPRWTTVCSVADALGVSVGDLRLDDPSHSRLAGQLAPGLDEGKP